MTHDELCRMEQSKLVKLIDEGKLVQVVRCKDCRRKVYCNLYNSLFGANGFCSEGARMDGESND